MAIDIGTYQIRVCHSIITQDSYINIVGYGCVTNEGCNRRGISSIEKMKESLSAAFQISKRSFEQKYSEKNLIDFENPLIIISVNGNGIYGTSNEGSISVHERVTSRDMEQAYNNCQALNKTDYQLITSCINWFQVDENMRVEEPLDMLAGQLKVNCYLMYGNNSYMSNMMECISFIHTKRQFEYAFTGFCSSISVVTEDEKALGVCVLNIGHNCTDICIYDKGDLIYCGGVPKGGAWITRQISLLYALSDKDAETLKCKYGVGYAEFVPDDAGVIRAITVGSNEEISIKRKELAEVIEHALTEIFDDVFENIITAFNGNNDVQMAAGFVITGGTAKIEGIDRAFLNHVYKTYDLKKVRVAKLREDQIIGDKEFLDPYSDAALVGMIRYSRDIESHDAVAPRGTIAKFFYKLKNWFTSEM